MKTSTELSLFSAGILRKYFIINSRIRVKFENKSTNIEQVGKIHLTIYIYVFLLRQFAHYQWPANEMIIKRNQFVKNAN